MTDDDTRLPSQRLPKLIPPPLIEWILEALDWLESLLAPKDVVIDLRSLSSGLKKVPHSMDVPLLDEFEVGFARNWLGRIVSLATQRLASGVDDAQAREWETVVDKSSRILTRSMGGSASGEMRRRYILPHPVEPNRALGIIVDETTLLSDSTGFRTWGSAPLFARRIATSPSDFLPTLDPMKNYVTDRLRILELGSGTGLVGLTIASVLSALSLSADLDLTDYENSVLDNLSTNLDHNWDVISRTVVNPRVSRLDWSDYHSTLSTESTDESSEKYDLIFASDVIYEPQHVSLIHTTVSRLLRRPSSARADRGGTFHLCLPLRSTHSVGLKAFQDMFPLRSEIVERSERLVIDNLDAIAAAKGEDGFGDGALITRRGGIGSGRGVEKYWLMRVSWS